jgi:glycosyltransferase involved in cell wall biosynthesis
MNVTASVSVLVPCRNAEPFLAETLESAIGQSLAPVEILVVDDGSTDRSREIARGYAPMVTLVSSPGRGASAARNHGSRLARGDFFQYLDADDLLEPHALSARIEALGRTGADVAISDWQRLERKGSRWTPAKVESSRLSDVGVPPDLAVFQGYWAPPAAILYRRSVWERIGAWRETLPVIQDARFLLDAARLESTFVHVPGVGARYRQHDRSSLSTKNAAAFWRDVLQNAREVEGLWSSERQLDGRRRAALASAYADCARVGFARDRRLFEESGVELQRFHDFSPSRLVRAAVLIDRIAGYRAARALLAPFQPRRRSIAP